MDSWNWIDWAMLVLFPIAGWNIWAKVRRARRSRPEIQSADALNAQVIATYRARNRRARLAVILIPVGIAVHIVFSRALLDAPAWVGVALTFGPATLIVVPLLIFANHCPACGKAIVVPFQKIRGPKQKLPWWLSVYENRNATPATCQQCGTWLVEPSSENR